MGMIDFGLCIPHNEAYTGTFCDSQNFAWPEMNTWLFGSMYPGDKKGFPPSCWFCWNNCVAAMDTVFWMNTLKWKWVAPDTGYFGKQRLWNIWIRLVTQLSIYGWFWYQFIWDVNLNIVWNQQDSSDCDCRLKLKTIIIGNGQAIWPKTAQVSSNPAVILDNSCGIYQHN